MLAPRCSLEPEAAVVQPLLAWLWCGRAAFVGGWLAWRRGGARIPTWALAAAAGFVLAMSRGSATMSCPLREAAAEELCLPVLATVTGIPHDSYGDFVFEADARAAGQDGATLPGWRGTLQLRVSADALGTGPDGRLPRCLAPGDRLRCFGRLYLPEPQMNPYEPDGRRTLLGSGVAARFGAETAERLPAGRLALLQYLPMRAAAWCYRRLDDLLRGNLSPAAAGLARALLLGDKAGLGQAERTAFERTGALHLLAVSGLHAGLFAATVAWAAGALRLGARPRAWLVTVVLGLYVLVTGSGPAVQRAAVMSLAALWKPASRKGGGSLSYLGAAALFLLVRDPLSAADPGLQLSFLASLGIVTWPLLAGKTLLAGKARRALASSLGAQVLTLPVVLHRFYRFCPYGPVIGLALLPLGGALITALFAAALAGLLCPPLFAILGPVLDLLLRGFVGVVAVLGRLPGSLLNIGHPAPAASACAAVATVWASLAASRPGGAAAARPAARAAAVALLAVGLLCVQSVWRNRAPSETTVDWFCVGQGDCALIHACGHAVLVDFAAPGPPGSQGGDRFSRAVLPYLNARRCRPDLGILSHPHADHVGGLRQAMLAFPRMKVITREVFRENLPGWLAPEDPAAGLQRRLVFLDAAAWMDLGPAAGRGPAGGTSGGAARLELFFASGEALGDDLNELSLVCRLAEAGGRQNNEPAADLTGLVLFTGDLGEDAEGRLLESASAWLPARILKVAHHGSGGSSTEAFLSAVGMKAAVVSVGENGYGHPSREALARIARAGAVALRTDQVGWVQARFRGQGFTIRTFRSPPSVQGSGGTLRETSLGEVIGCSKAGICPTARPRPGSEPGGSPGCTLSGATTTSAAA